MDVTQSDYLMTIPDYVAGIHILVVDPNMASLKRTISLLEEATYQVTIARQPDEALSILQERKNEYTLVIAAVNMQGMDCLTFLKTVKTLHNIPVALTSTGMDHHILKHLSMSSLRQGAIQFFEKPMSRDEARYLWQHVLSKGRRKTVPEVKNEENELNQSNNPDKLIRDSNKGKGKEIEIPAKEKQQEIQKRKRSDYGNKEKTNHDTKNKSQATTKKAKNSDKNPIRWNNELHAMFMKTLSKDSKKATPAPAKQEFETMSTTLQAQASTDMQISRGRCPNSETVPSTRYAREEMQSIPYFKSITGAENKLHGTSRPNFCPESQLIGASNQNLGKDISHLGAINGASSINQTSILLHNNNQLAANNITDNESNLRGRIDQIRHAYWTNTQTGNEKFMPNFYGSSSSEMGYSPLLNVCPPHQVQSSCASSMNYFPSFMKNYGNLQMEPTGTFQTPNYPYSDSNYNSMLPPDNLAYQAIPANDLSKENLVDFGAMYSNEQILNNAGGSNILQPTEDDMYLHGILAELQYDYANNDLRSLGFDTSIL